MDEDPPPPDDEQAAPGVKRRRRSVRHRHPRKKSIAPKRLTRKMLSDEWERLGVYTDEDKEVLLLDRPTTRGECREESRPCPWVSCKHHLYLDINPETGAITINFPDLEPWELTSTCSLDVAERGGITLEEVGEIMNLTRERIRQVEVRGLLKVRPEATKRDMHLIELGNRRQTGLGEAQDSLEVSVSPSDVTFQSG